ncbi:hypothetical protein EDEG_00307 [Edhazardia aedis USNM 41457]|uniref:Uncharacterized protein n=1 Tax=Edhazardia aedis (strain USNM 41457) TaxID=1003232 RepID=J9D2X9_EDHAE|nr:hypothetical protein EDEG_00307 [Edhazardia aedis USNM 41457]|eukprot:EJW02166.1 hypothetical protein EDEG_00307 [Edhazardia aedis USNM 41457]
MKLIAIFLFIALFFKISKGLLPIFFDENLPSNSTEDKKDDIIQINELRKCSSDINVDKDSLYFESNKILLEFEIKKIEDDQNTMLYKNLSSISAKLDAKSKELSRLLKMGKNQLSESIYSKNFRLKVASLFNDEKELMKKTLFTFLAIAKLMDTPKIIGQYHQ